MKKWRYDSSRDLERTPLDRLRQFPREPDMLVYGLRSIVALCQVVGLGREPPREAGGMERSRTEGDGADAALPSGRGWDPGVALGPSFPRKSLERR